MRSIKITLITILLFTIFPLKLYNSEESISLKETLICKYYESLEFNNSILNSKQTKIDGEIYGGIVPHHLLANDMIADFFKTISIKKPKVIIILGPNHKAKGYHKFQTSSLEWNTPYGILQSDSKLIKNLVNQNVLYENDELMTEEHSISSLIPYVKYYFNDSKVIPILITGGRSVEECKDLSETILNEIKNKSYLVIASVDFSHYLTLNEANKKDEITINAINNRNLNEISFMNNDYMDSPPSIITLLNIMNEENVFNSKVIKHNNSAVILGKDIKETTSYFTLVYYK